MPRKSVPAVSITQKSAPAMLCCNAVMDRRSVKYWFMPTIRLSGGLRPLSSDEGGWNLSLWEFCAPLLQAALSAATPLRHHGRVKWEPEDCHSSALAGKPAQCNILWTQRGCPTGCINMYGSDHNKHTASGAVLSTRGLCKQRLTAFHSSNSWMGP